MANPKEEQSGGERTGKCPACKTEGVKLKEVNGLLICEKCSSKRFSSKVRKGIQEAFERQQEQRRKEAWRHRIDIAKRGVLLYEKGKLPEALKTFRDYISILENRFGVGAGGLNLGVFDIKKDAGEILLIAGIYWDMAKIYDHMKGHQGEMRHCLNKFLEFSIGRPHIILSAEAIRKYMTSGRCSNVNDFKSAHMLITRHLTKCFVATAVFGPMSSEVETLREFRDTRLAPHFAGRAFIRLYYAISPPIAHALIKAPIAAIPVRFVLGSFTKGLRRLYKI